MRRKSAGGLAGREGLRGEEPRKLLGAQSVTAPWREMALLAALLLYGLFSAPAPPAVGSAETAVGLLLVAATGLRQPVALVSGALLAVPGARAFEIAGCGAFLVLFWLPLLRGAALDWQLRDIVRDVVPLLFLFLPVLLAPVLRPAGARAVAVLAAALAAAGVAFALRWWIDAGWAFGAIGHRAMSDGPRYLLNSPAVLFAALWLPIQAVRLVWPELAGETPPPAAGRGLRLALALPLLAAALLILAALAGAVHRMALVLVAAAGLAFLGWCARRSTGPVVLALAVLAALLLVPGGPLPGALEMVVIKSELVGVNERFAEAEAVLAQIGRSLPSLLLGDGWGTLVANPAVGGWRVSFTHSFPSYLLLKTGIVGTLVMLAWLGTLLPAAAALVRRDLPLALAVLPPVAGGLLLHTSFKYLCFGLLLTVLVLAGEPEEAPPAR